MFRDVQRWRKMVQMCFDRGAWAQNRKKGKGTTMDIPQKCDEVTRECNICDHWVFEVGENFG